MNVTSARGHRSAGWSGRGQRRRAAAVAGLTGLFLVIAGVVASSPASAATSWSPAGACGTVQSTTVPAGVHHLTVDLSGGNGGKGGVQSSGTPGPPGVGGRIIVSYSVSPGDVLSAIVGCNGAAGDPANDDVPTPQSKGWSKGGGTGQGQNTLIFPHGAGGGAGGGSSAVCLGASCISGSSTPLAVAGGGGGSGSSDCAGTTGGPGGDGGGSNTFSNIDNGTGTNGSDGQSGASSGSTNAGIAGGAGGVNASGRGADGGSNSDGSGGLGVNVVGGGGGGGYVGGGAGANASGGCVAGGSGGGGSSWYNLGYEGFPARNKGTGGAVVITFADPDQTTSTTTPPSTLGPPSTWTPSGPCGTVSSTIVPGNVNSISVDVAGGNGGKGGGQSGGTTGAGGTAGRVKATFAVTAGQIISGVVACNGADGDSSNSDIPTPATSGWSKGGGTGQGSNTGLFPHGAGGGAGGGSSAICLGATCISGTGIPLVVAGGGGGSGSSSCNGTTGGNGGNAGTGATTSTGNGSGASGITGGPGAADGSQNGGIPGGAGGVNSAGGTGNGGSAPDGSGGSGVSVVGGGGGAGYVGGGAGANIDTGCRAGGAGGGGSSWVKDTATGTSTSGLASGPQAVVTFASPSLYAPGAPTIGAVASGGSQATLSWTAPASNGGSPITSYVVTPYIATTEQPSQTFNSTATKQAIVDLANGYTYTFTVTAVNAVGSSPPSARSVAVVVGTPGQPVFQSAASGNASAKVSWYPPSGNGDVISGYYITPYIGSVAQYPAFFSGAANSQVVTGLTNGTTYTFKIVATNSWGDGPASPPTAPIVVGVPGAPAFQTATPTGSGSAKVSWYPATPNGGPITSHTITPYIGTVAQTPQVFTTSANSDVVTGLTNGATYTFKIYATNAFGNGPSSPATAAITIGIPGAPAFQSATATGSGSAKVSWYPAASNGGPITSHTITPYIGTVAQTPQTFNTSANSDTLTGLTNGTVYTFKIVATNAFGSGPASPATNAVTIGVPGQPVLQSAVPAGSGSAKVSWYPAAPNGGPITSHTITPYIGTVAQTPQTFNTSANSDTLTGLTNGTAYTFKIVATNAYGDSIASPATNAVTIGVPGQPVLQSATPGNGTAKVQWYPPAANGGPITKYTITPYIGTVAQTPQVFNTSANSDILTGLTNGTTYTFKIVATNAFGDSIASPATAAITVGAPLAPATPVVVPDVQQATVTWVAPADNGSAITGYVVTPFIGSTAQPAVTFTSTATTQVLTGLTTGTSYTFKVAAVNANGTSTLSPASLAAVIL